MKGEVTKREQEKKRERERKLLPNGQMLGVESQCSQEHVLLSGFLVGTRDQEVEPSSTTVSGSLVGST